jgi:hypothetical protein
MWKVRVYKDLKKAAFVVQQIPIVLQPHWNFHFCTLHKGIVCESPPQLQVFATIIRQRSIRKVFAKMD